MTATTVYSFHLLRQTSFTRWRRVGWGVSAVAHALSFVLLFAGPALFAPEPEPIEYVAVQVVPLQALGLPDAPIATEPAPRRRPEPQQPAAEPEPEPEEQSPAPRTAPERPAPVKPSATASGGDEKPEPASAPPRPAGATRGSPQGSPTSNLAFGATEVAGLDNPDFVYGYYLNQMLGMIHSQWNRPALGSGVEAIVAFRVARDGSVSGLRISQSSGYSQYDLAALRAVQSAAPFPPLPQSYRHGSLGVNLRVQ